MEFFDFTLAIFDFMQGILNAQTNGTGMGGVCDPTAASVVGFNNYCPASSFTAIGAAFATMGYWMQSDLLDHLTFSSLGIWAPLVYIISAVGGMFGVAMGQPPRNYVWFFIGPALYAWLIDTRTDVDGVAWRVAGIAQNQSEVWKLSEVGLINSNLYQRMEAYSSTSVRVSADEGPRVPVGITNMSESPRSAVAVAMPFLWFDWLISGTVDSLVDWTGVYRQSSRAAVPNLRTNITSDGASTNDDKWYLLSNLKWTYLEDISGAKVGHPMIRASLAQFMGSECGEALTESIDHKLFTAATTSKGLSIPTTVFRRPDGTPDLFNYSVLKTKLRLKHIPTPPPFKRALTKSQAFSNVAGWTIEESINWGSGVQLAGGGSGSHFERAQELDTIRCDHFLDMLILLFRYEAAAIYNTTFKDSNIPDLDDFNIVDNILYGWDIKKQRNGTTPGNTHVVASGEIVANDGVSLDSWERFQFVHNLILMNLMRNELAVSPAKADVRYSLSQQTTGWMQAYQANVGSKVKYMELYTWAILIPYMQGILMYFLAMMYPIACIMVIMPGQHKWIFTWASFWAWVKLWDLGFAIVTSLERSVWAMIGNNAQITKVFDRIVELDVIGSYNAMCPADIDPAMPGCKWYIYDIGSCGLKHTVDGTCTSAANVLGNSINLDMQDVNLRFLDMALTIGPSLDLGLANSYYIYIMAALYMAVPAITGQLVLGARSGAAGMVNSAIGGVSQESGRQGGEGFKGKKVQDDKLTEMARKQAVVGKGHRKSGLAGAAIGLSNSAAMQNMAADAQGQIGSGYDRKQNVAALIRQNKEAGLNLLGAAVGALSGSGNGISPNAGATGSASTGTEINDKAGTKRSGPEGGEEVSNEQASAAQTQASREASAAARREAASNNLRRQGQGAVAGKANDLLNAAGSAGVANTLLSAGKSAAQQENFRADNMYAGLRGNSQIAGFGHSQAARGNQEHGQRTGQAADFNAEMGAWMEMSEWADSISGSSTAQGALAGTFAQGNIPTGQMGMAMSGMLGSGTKNAANFFKQGQQGGFMQSAFGVQSALQTQFGKAVTDGMYREYSMGQTAADAVVDGAKFAVQTNKDGTQAQQNQAQRKKNN